MDHEQVVGTAARNLGPKASRRANRVGTISDSRHGAAMTVFSVGPLPTLKPTNKITVQSHAAELNWHGLALKRKRESVARHPAGQYRQHVMDGVTTLPQQHVAEEPSLFWRERTYERVIHIVIRGFEEVAALGNHLLRNRLRCLVDQLINNGFVGVNRST
jgi:hypothetical protein